MVASSVSIYSSININNNNFIPRKHLVWTITKNNGWKIKKNVEINFSLKTTQIQPSWEMLVFGGYSLKSVITSGFKLRMWNS